ncbi:MAG: hypothetical protein ACREDS_10795 [Limisphaerales bacterium]
MSTVKTIFAGVIFFAGCALSVHAQSKHSSTSRYPSYQGLVMCGYVPCVYPEFSWHNLSRFEFARAAHPVNQIPRLKGKFYWGEISGAIQSGAKMFYVAMFDEMDESAAIFKCTDTPPIGSQFVTYEGLPSDYYLWLMGEAGKMLRGQMPFFEQLPVRENTKFGTSTSR